jgi:hypothetical protein
LRKLLFGAAASTLLAPAAAHAETTGFVDAAYEHSQVQGGGAAESPNFGAGVQHDFDSGWGVQADGRSTHFDVSDFNAGYAAIHVYFAVSPNLDVGAFVGLSDFLLNNGESVGVEARVHQGQWSLQGSVGYTHFDPISGTSEVWDARALGAWFLNQDTALTPSVSYTEWQDTAFLDKQAGIGIGVTHRFNNGLQWYASYIYSANDSTVDGQYQVDTVRIGLRFNFSAGDLQTITNDGASWNGAAGMYEALARF